MTAKIILFLFICFFIYLLSLGIRKIYSTLKKGRGCNCSSGDGKDCCCHKDE